MAKTNFDKVCEFNTTFDFPILGHTPNVLDDTKIAKLRYDLIVEEGIVEFKKAVKENNKIEMLDSIADHLYVLYGLCYTYGFNPDSYVRMTFNFNKKTRFTEKNLTNYELIYNSDFTTSNDDIFSENCELVDLLKKALLEDKDIVDTYIITMCLIVNTYKLGINLKIDVDRLFDIVHSSNMSKVCKTEHDAKLTVHYYERNYASGNSPYDTPYYYENKGYYLIKNKSTGKSLKSIYYTPVSLDIDSLTVL